MKITVIGGGPAGLYFSILVKKAIPECEINLYERNKADDTFGFGVVFSDETLNEFLSQDKRSYELIKNSFAYWDDIDIARNGEIVRVEGNGFCGCSRKTLLLLLIQRCKEEGVQLYFETNVEDISLFKDSDLIIAGDGINSGIRTKFADYFGTKIEMRPNRFVWLGSDKPLDAFTYFFRSTPMGALVAHTYQYEKGKSTWVIETTEETFRKIGFDVYNEEDTIQKIETIFKQELDGHKLISNKSYWRNFPVVTNKVWYKDNIILIGDAVATAHFSIGSGTKLAMESAIALANAVVKKGKDAKAVFEEYEKNTRNNVEMIQYAANVSLSWFEDMDRHLKQDFMSFAFSVMARSKKITFENLKRRDKVFAQKVLHHFNSTHSIPDKNTSPAFTPFTLRGMTLPNRVVMSPMGQYSAQDGLVNNWHLVHYGSRATAGVGLILTEMTAVSPYARISPGCAGIWTDEQAFAWKRVVDFIHQHSNSKIGMQLGHSGPKGSTNRIWDGLFTPLRENNWTVAAASPIAFTKGMQIPEELTIAQMDILVNDFTAAAKRADEIGFDMLELQACHGLLLATFLSPLTNKRTDEFGGSVENRIKFPLRVFKSIRENFDIKKPLSVKLSVEDWAENGISRADSIAIAEAFKQAGADILNISTGGTVKDENPVKGRMWQVPFSDTIRNTVNIPTVAVGQIENLDQVNTVLLSGRADLVALGRPLLLDPSFIRQAQAYEQFHGEDLSKLQVPKQYQRGLSHLYPFQKKIRKEFESMKLALKPKSHKK